MTIEELPVLEGRSVTRASISPPQIRHLMWSSCIAEHSRGEGPLVEAHGHVIRPADAAPREAVLDEVEWRI
jgi:hypothetical protein